MTVQAQRGTHLAGQRRSHAIGYRLARRLRRLARSIVTRFSSTLTRRIVVLNLGGLAALFVAFLYVNQFRAGLIDARVQSLQTQSEIIAAAIASSATVQTDSMTIDPERLLQLAPGQSDPTAEESSSSLEFSIDPVRIGPVLNRLVSPTRTRARVYDRDGALLLDSRWLSSRGRVFLDDRPAPAEEPTILERAWNVVKRRLSTLPLPTEDASSGNGKTFPEVKKALEDRSQAFVRVNARGQTIVSVAVPIRSGKNSPARGALLLSTEGGDIDATIAADRWSIVQVFLLSAGVMFLLSLFLAGTIAGPMRRLAEAAERVRRGIRSRQQIPDYTRRSDEIGHLSGALRDMTKALYSRLEAIEQFAADVAHELKNPLTSLRSAIETLPRMKTDAQRERLFEVIQHDVRRLDRLISDISDASRLDAELGRGDREPVDLKALVATVVDVAKVNTQDGVAVTLEVAGPAAPGEPARPSFYVLGNDLRLSQVVNNLIDNARSFSPPGGTVCVRLRRARGHANRDAIEIIVDDEGPGIPPHALERIFERFYTDRPTHSFGQNSGLGLSISRQIIAAHGGSIYASNRMNGAEVIGASFVVRLDPPR